MLRLMRPRAAPTIRDTQTYPSSDSADSGSEEPDDTVRREGHPVVLRRQPQHGPADLQGQHRPGRDRHPQALRPDRQVHLRPGLPVDGVVRFRDHLHRRRQGRAALPRLSDRAAGARTATSSRSATCCSTASCPTQKQKDDFVAPREPAHDGQRADAVLPARLPARRAPDGGADGPGRRHVGLLSRQHRHQQSEAPRDRRHPADRQDADAGVDGLQVRASASPTSIRRTRSATPATSCA